MLLILQQVKADGTCHRNHQMVYVMSRTTSLDSYIQRRLDYITENYLCVDPESLVFIPQTRT